MSIAKEQEKHTSSASQTLLSDGELPGSDAGHREHEGHEHSLEVLDVLRVLFVAGAAAAVWFHVWEPFARVSVIGLIATLAGGYPIFREALENIIERRMTMELS